MGDTLESALERIEKSIAEDSFHPGDVLTIEIGNDVSLEDEHTMYTAAVEALSAKGCDFVKVRMKRPVEA